MDGATNMNPSNAPQALTASASETKKLEKFIAKEEAAAEKHIAHVSKALKSAEKDDRKAEKATQKALRARDKAVKQEHQTELALGEAQLRHDLAVAGENKAVHELSVRQRYLQEAHQTVENRRIELEQARRRKDAGDVARNLKGRLH
ncbi:hypothetical protein BJV78DRAFT_1197257 [Lactifluus subvellereus]|nr:hypothetical protein BJV78DRAFT_1197257 [Lactifluus subvellereus]